jgi:hypothetical protein
MKVQPFTQFSAKDYQAIHEAIARAEDRGDEVAMACLYHYIHILKQMFATVFLDDPKPMPPGERPDTAKSIGEAMKEIQRQSNDRR